MTNTKTKSFFFLLQVWKRSGAWFFKGIPKYTTPKQRMHDTGKFSSSPKNRMENQGPRKGSIRSYHTWCRGRGGSSNKITYGGKRQKEERQKLNHLLFGRLEEIPY